MANSPKIQTKHHLCNLNGTDLSNKKEMKQNRINITWVWTMMVNNMGTNHNKSAGILHKNRKKSSKKVFFYFLFQYTSWVITKINGILFRWSTICEKNNVPMNLEIGFTVYEPAIFKTYFSSRIYWKNVPNMFSD